MPPVLYLTPQLTRTVRFPRQYVISNQDWNETIKHTVWDAALTFMARRPEIPAKFGNWGLMLRLNVANALFCRDWYFDAKQSKLDDATKPEKLVNIVTNYVERNSGEDRGLGSVVDELRTIGVDVPADWLDAKGQPATPSAREAIRNKFREQLFEATFACVFTTYTLLFEHPRNRKVGVDEGGFEAMQPKCGYADPENRLDSLFGSDDALILLQDLPLRRLTPAYDVVGMICADASLEDNDEVDGGLGLVLEHADRTMGLDLLPEDKRAWSDHAVWMTPPQTGEGIYAVGPFG